MLFQYTQHITCGIMDIFLRRSCSPMSVICIPSISNTPSGSANLNNADNKEDLPAPVLPTMPIYGHIISHLGNAVVPKD